MAAWALLAERFAAGFAQHLWQGTLFALVVAGFAWILRKAPARYRYWAYLLAGMKFLLPSALLVALARQLSLVPTGWLPEPVAMALDGRPLVAAAETLAGSRGFVDSLWLVATAAWALVAMALLLRWAFRLAAWSRHLRAATPAGPALAIRFRALAGRAGVKTPVRLVLAEAVAEPGVWGVWRPVVVLPAALPTRLEPSELDAVLLHELVHVGRRDNLAGNLGMVLSCIFWFHPLVWWLDRQLLAERERACDERVVELAGGAGDYLRGIAKTLTLGAGLRLAGYASAGDSDLRRRLRHLEAGARPRASLLHRGVLATSCVLLAAFTLAAGDLCRESAGALVARTPRQVLEATREKGPAPLVLPDHAPDPACRERKTPEVAS